MLSGADLIAFQKKARLSDKYSLNILSSINFSKLFSYIDQYCFIIDNE